MILPMGGCRGKRCCWRCTCTWRIIVDRQRSICETRESSRPGIVFKEGFEFQVSVSSDPSTPCFRLNPYVEDAVIRYPALVNSMTKAITVAAYLLAASLAYASSCPVMLVSGMRDVDGIVVTFRNAGKLPIRDLEFNCSLARAAQPPQRMACREKNALFYPGMEYTLRYPQPRGTGQVTVSVKSATLSDGYVFRPSKRQSCRTLRISPGRTKK